MAKKSEKEQYDVEGIIVIEDKKHKDEFDLGSDKNDDAMDDDELDFDDFDADDGGD